jgi:hypothetical protein
VRDGGWVLALVLTSAAIMGTPGPAIISLTAAGTAFGIRRSLGYLAGIIAGTVAVLGAVATGVTAVLLGVPGMRPVLIGLSAIYILWLAYHLATATPQSAQTQVADAPSLAAGRCCWPTPRRGSRSVQLDRSGMVPASLDDVIWRERPAAVYVQAGPADPNGADGAAAVDNDALAGDEARLLGYEEAHRVCDVVRYTHPARGHRCKIGVPDLRRDIGMALNGDEARRDGIHRDAEGCQLTSPAAGETDLRALRGGIGRPAWGRPVRDLRVDVDDAPEPPRLHSGDDRASEQHRALDEESELGEVILPGHLGQRGFWLRAVALSTSTSRDPRRSATASTSSATCC